MLLPHPPCTWLNSWFGTSLLLILSLHFCLIPKNKNLRTLVNRDVVCNNGSRSLEETRKRCFLGGRGAHMKWLTVLLWTRAQSRIGCATPSGLAPLLCPPCCHLPIHCCLCSPPGLRGDSPSPPPLTLLLLLLLPAIGCGGHGGRGGEAEGGGPASNPKNVPTATRASKRCSFWSRKDKQGGGRGTSWDGGAGGVAMITNPSLSW